MTASRQATTPATCGESRRTETTPVTYARTVAIRMIQASRTAAGTAVPAMWASPARSDQSMVQGLATAVRTRVPTSRPYAITPSGSGASSPASLPWSDRTK